MIKYDLTFLSFELSSLDDRSRTVRRYNDSLSLFYQLKTGLGLNDAAQITSNAHFSNDLGLDSLDTVEVVMAIEEVCNIRFKIPLIQLSAMQEFSIEIPDKEADAIHSGTYQ